MRIRDARDFWSGIMFAAFGLFFMVFARHYEMGTAARMGPAYFPLVLGGLLLLLGTLISFRSLAAQAVEASVERFHFRPLACVLGAAVAFGLLLQPAGLVIALAVLVLISSLGSVEFRLRDVLLLTAGLAILVLAVFIYGLGMTVPVLPAFLRD